MDLCLLVADELWQVEARGVIKLATNCFSRRFKYTFLDTLAIMSARERAALTSSLSLPLSAASLQSSVFSPFLQSPSQTMPTTTSLDFDELQRSVLASIVVAPCNTLINLRLRR